MRRLPLRALLGGAVEDERILYHNLWLRRHGNARYEQLLPRLTRLDAYLLEISGRRPLAAAQWRALERAKRLRHAAILRLGARRYRWLLTTDLEQIPAFPGEGIVADVDDPAFTEREAELLGRPNVRAFVVTAAWAGERFAELGVRTPWHVVPQGFDPRLLAAGSAPPKRPGETVVGFVGSWLLSAGDRRGTNPLWNVDHLLDLWPEIRTRVPAARLWLVGTPSARVRERCRGRDDVLLVGPLPRRDVLAHVARFDVALYPRERDQGVSSMKIAEYIGAGVPTVSYDYRVTEILRETGAGVLVDTPREFVEAVARLASDPAERERRSAGARAAAAGLDWDGLARRLEHDVLDRYLES